MGELNKYKYQIKEKASNPEDSVILKTGIEEVKAEFSFNDINKDITTLNKKKLELEGKIKVETAKIQNVKDYHPETEKMDEKARIAASIYQISTEEVRIAEKYLEAIKERLDLYAKEMEEISRQTGIEIQCPEKTK